MDSTRKVTYTVSADLLNNINKKLVERYELDMLDQEEEKSKHITHSKKKQKIVIQPTRSASSSDYRDDDEDDDNDDEDEEDDIHDFIMYSDEEEQTPLATSRGRRIMKPRAYHRDFTTQLPTSKKTSKKPFKIPNYTDEPFIQHHSLICFRCLRTGQINGSELVFLGTEKKRSRLLLCQTCSISVHNNCLPTTTSIDKTTGELKCAKCINNGTCFGCHKSILEKKSEYVAFRCVTCSRAFHHECILDAASPALADEIKKHDITLLYQSGKCIECLIFANRTPQIIASERTSNDGRVECLIKWKSESYRHTNWVLADWVSQVSPSLFRGYLKRKEAHGISQVSEDWTVVDRILNVEWEDKSNQKVKRILAVYKDSEYGDAVWDEPPNEEETDVYPDYQAALKRYIQASQVKPPKNMYGLIESVRAAATAESYQRHEIKEQPDFVKGGTLMKHQMEALNWLIYQWEKKQSCILADDMATNWIREFEKWAPEMTVAPYFGLNVARKLALHNEILDSHERIKCHVVVATYESIMESSPLHRLFWPILIVDESQRLKSDESYLFKTLSSCRVDHTVLLTGTPLQNNLKELFNIMNFIHPKAFQGSEAKDYENMTASQVEELHSRLRPHFLRRTKEEVLKELPPKYELIVPLSMTPLQKEVYKQCLSREIYETLALANGHKRQKGLTNIFTNLRKNLNHPYLLDGVEKQQPTSKLVQKTMIDACAKLKLFHQMFPKLKQNGHRILLFSTMTRALDIMEDYLTYEQIQYTRIDGSTRERDRVRSIDAFNAPDSKLDVFLLSTRAGGVGINLTTADTVIIWDSDFNPYADLQAISRAHRIGQTKMVLIYRFMTRLTVEEKVLQIGKKKMALEHVVVERMKADEEEKLEDVESILKFGTEALFADDDSKDIVYDDAAIDNLLDREQYRQVATEQQIKEIEESEGKSNENGSMNFSFAKVWQADGTIEELATEEDVGAEKKETDFWEKFLLEQQAVAEKKKEEKRIAEQNLGRGARKRANIVSS
ncbi:P-loop containing nucleoside triphosphate hydrolase protein [Gilbertella persicaria]|uniref:P-loop containing nucleoside triphosphate hydrolase protein n=1 Tax=Gilbertella persicaria TaxID=101096 RepID=UPI00221E7870|nr:P-loop containing nucleoside triphosphate hydrolase protein [Gilbertella persicaria]KAI8085910.1 P-loop containing nucleoside triphosphate hydrolase protein [Gilbertella persicaria]